MKKNIFLFSLGFIFLSCATKPLLLPGEKNALVQNIYAEYFNIAEEYFKLKNYSKAEEFYKISKDNKSLSSLSLYRLADCSLQLKKWDDAISLYEKLLKNDSENSTLKENLAYALAMKGDYEKSLFIYNELLEKSPMNETYLENALIVLFADNKNISDNSLKIKSLIEKLESLNGENENLSKFKEKFEELNVL